VTSACHAAQKAAFEIVEIEQQVLALSGVEVKQHLDPASLLDGLQDGFRRLELGEIQSPPRPEITVPGKGFSLPMAAWAPGMQICVKVVNVFEGNLGIGLPNHLATHSAMPVIAPDWVRPGTASLLPGPLSATRTGLSRASDDELADQSSITHMINTNLSGHTGDAR
jgi:ornithine cyclodeaminase/alanine dehydrogenase-like protein (mu-crystallin family)